MPNIEMYGFADVAMMEKMAESEALETTIENFNKTVAILKQTKQRIWKQLDGASYLSEVVITESYLSAEVRDGSRAPPFLRIWATSQQEVDDIVNRLEPLDIDIEVAPLLAKWIERRSVRLRDGRFWPTKHP